ncbi:MAG: urease accessory protein UreH domain-containing protein, partial [Planctomycetota bacterium]
MPFATIAQAVWFGILTSISPCPLATNIAAVSFISKKVGSKRYVLLSGLLYTLGRTAAYVAVAALITAGISFLPKASLAMFLQNYGSKILGPVLIILGMILADLIGLKTSLSLGGRRVQQRAAEGGVWWACILGVLFAMSFCPISAGLFLGRVVPLSVEHKSLFLLP